MDVVGNVVGRNIPIWPSCPAIGWDAGVFRGNSTYDGTGLSAGTRQNLTGIEEHGPYLHGGSFTNPAVNGVNNNNYPSGYYFDPQLPVDYSGDREETGPTKHNKFVSEFGTSVYSR